MNSNATAINNDDATSTTSLMTTMMQMMMEQQKSQQLMMFEHQKNQQELLNKFMEIQERQTTSLEKQTNSFSQLITQLISSPTLIASATSTSTSTTITSTPTPITTPTPTPIVDTFTANTPTATLDSILMDNKATIRFMDAMDAIDAMDSSPEPKKTTSKKHAQPLEIETISKKKRKNEEEEKDMNNKDKKQKVGNDTKEKEKEKEKKKSTTTTTTTTTTTSTLVLLNPICSYCNTKITAKKQITTTVFKNCHPMHIACSVQMICEDGQITCPAAKCGVECKTVMSLLNVKNFFLSRHLKYEQYYNDNLKFIKKPTKSITTEKTTPKTISIPTINHVATATTSTPTLIHDKINNLLKESSKTTPTPISTPTTPTINHVAVATTPTLTTPTSPISNLTATVKIATPQQQIIKEEYKVQPMDDLYSSSSSLLKAITNKPIANQYDDSDNTNEEDVDDLLDFWLLTRKKSNTRPFNNDQI